VLPPVAGWTRVYQPTGTRWSNPLGGWTAKADGISIFNSDRSFTIACHGPDDQKRFYIDIAHRVRVRGDVLEFVDLFLDVMIDPSGAVSEKDEHQLIFLASDKRRFARAARDEVRRLIVADDPLFDPRGVYYAVPEAAKALPPSNLTTELS
jgi:protein associated with RNAse G/E